MAQVFSTHPLHPAVEARLRAAADYVVASAPVGAAFLAEGLTADAIIVRAPLPEAYFARAVGLRAAIRHGAGLDMVPMAVATAAGVLVGNVPGVNARTVAEHVIFAAIGLLRQFRAVDGALRMQGWAAGRAFADGSQELGGRVVGIYGMGNIGREVARIAMQGFGLGVIATTRSGAGMPGGVGRVTLDDLVAQADIVVVCCPLTDETRGSVSAARLAAMKPGAVLVNVARGPVLDQGALVAALQRGHLGGAALDVFDEQPLAAGHPLFALPNVILTPHVAGITEQSMRRMGDGAADEVLRVLAGDLPVNLRNPEVVAAYRRRFG